MSAELRYRGGVTRIIPLQGACGVVASVNAEFRTVLG